MHFISRLLLLLFLLFGLVAVGPAFAQTSSRCITDDSHREVCLDHPARRIISLSPGLTELLFAAGAGPQVIAVESSSDYPPQVESLPKVGGYTDLNAEVVMAMEPDLVVVWSGGNSSPKIHKLKALGVTTLNLDPKDFQGISSAIRRLGVIAGTEAKAQQTAKAFDERQAALKRQYQSRPAVSVFYEIWRKPLLTMNRNQIISQAISLCGGQNIFADASVLIPQVSQEMLVARNPEVILGSDHQPTTGSTALESLKAFWKPLDTITAVRKQQIYTLPGDMISRPTLRLLTATEEMCKILEDVRGKRPRQ